MIFPAPLNLTSTWNQCARNLRAFSVTTVETFKLIKIKRAFKRVI